MKYKITEKYTEKRIQEILKIKQQKGLTPELLEEEAKDPNNPLHELFEWNNKKGGYQWRLQQARLIINEIKVIVDSKEFFAFENVKLIINTMDGEEYNREYVERSEILNSPQLRKQIIQKAYEQLFYWKQKHEQYSEFKPVIASIDKLKLERGKK